MFSPHGPTLRELSIQALSSVEHGYDLLAPKFDYTPFRTRQSILEATVHALSEVGTFRNGLDVCCGTGAGLIVLQSTCQGVITGVDFSAGMLAQARSTHPDATLVRADARALPFREGFDLAVTFGALGHFLPTERPALFEGVHRALRPGGLFAFPIGASRVFPASASLLAPVWLLERGTCAWLAVLHRCLFGGVHYAGRRLRHAATAPSPPAIQRRKPDQHRMRPWPRAHAAARLVSAVLIPIAPHLGGQPVRPCRKPSPP